MKYGYRSSFSYKGWYNKHKDLSKVTVRDLVRADKINEEAVCAIYEKVRKAFTDSDEYNWREYRYKNISELKNSRKEAPEAEAAVKSAISQTLKEPTKAI